MTHALPLDEAEQPDKLKPVIGIRDDDELKRHLLEVRAEAYAVSHSADQLGNECENAIFLGLPCSSGKQTSSFQL